MKSAQLEDVLKKVSFKPPTKKNQNIFEYLVNDIPSNLIFDRKVAK